MDPPPTHLSGSEVEIQEPTSLFNEDSHQHFVQGAEPPYSDIAHSYPYPSKEVHDTEGQGIQQGAGIASGMENTTPDFYRDTIFNLSLQ